MSCKKQRLWANQAKKTMDRIVNIRRKLLYPHQRFVVEPW